MKAYTRERAIQRFWERVERGGPDECWPWTAARKGTPYAYGHLLFLGRFSSAHRVAWELTNGPIPEGLHACHHCDNPPCCNPSHLFLGTAKDNARDMVEKGRHRPGRLPGELHPNARLTWERVAEIRRRYAAHPHPTGRPGHGVPDSTGALAAEFGVAQSTVSRIVLGRAWKVPA